MAAARESDATIYVAIDVGTTMSGYAFVIGKDSTNYDAIPDEVDKGYKCPTILLLRASEGNELVHFGKMAWTCYENLESEEKKNFYLFDRFKMRLPLKGVSTCTCRADATTPFFTVPVWHYLACGSELELGIKFSVLLINR